MQKMILLFLFLTLSAHAENKLEASVISYGDVLNNCNQLTHAQWIKKYSEAEDQVIEAVGKDPKLASSKDRELLEVVFPQDLPKSHPMKGAFVSCFEIFNDYQKAINNVESMSALKKLESCYEDAYKKDPPKVVGQYMDCLKKIKY